MFPTKFINFQNPSRYVDLGFQFQQPEVSKKAKDWGQDLLFSPKICVCPSDFAYYSPIVCPPPQTPCIVFKQQKQLMMRTPRYSTKYPNFIPSKYFTIFT